MTEHIEPNSRIQIVKANNEIELIPNSLISYRNLFNDGTGGWITATLHEDGLFHAVINTGKEYLQIDPLHEHTEHLDDKTHKTLSEASNHGMIMFRLQDFKNRKNGENDQEALLNSINQKLGSNLPTNIESLQNITSIHLNKHVHSNHTHLSVFNDYPHYAGDGTCFGLGDNVPQSFSIGIVVTYGYFKSCGSSMTNTQQSIAGIFATVSNIFRQSFNIIPTSIEQDYLIYTFPDSYTPTFNQGCASTIENQRDLFKDYIYSQKIYRNSLWYV
jgi:hypothetical protein